MELDWLRPIIRRVKIVHFGWLLQQQSSTKSKGDRLGNYD
jgi:hypothetical protein